MKGKSNKPVGLINSFFGGGAERQMAFLVEQGIVERVYTLEPDRQHDVAGNVEWIGYSWIPKSFRFLAVPVFALRLALRIQRDQSVVSFTERSNFVNIVSKLIRPHVALVSVRTNPVLAYRGKKTIVGLIARFLYRFADRVITNSVGAKSELARHYGIADEKIVTIYNGVDYETIKWQAEQPLQNELSEVFQKGPVGLMVGRLEHPKGYANALRAFAYVHREIPDAQLVIVGIGSLQSKLETLATELEIAKNVHFIGFHKNPFNLIAHADVVILTSLWEGMPNIMLESVTCGTPVVAVDCDFGPREILAPDVQDIDGIYRSSGGILVAQGEIELLAQSIIAVLNDPLAKQWVRNAEFGILKRFLPEQVTASWQQLLNIEHG